MGGGHEANLTQTRPAGGGWVGGEAETALGDGVGADVRTEVLSLSSDQVETEEYGGKMDRTTRK